MSEQEYYVKLQDALNACEAAVSKTYSAEEIVAEVKKYLGVLDCLPEDQY